MRSESSTTVRILTIDECLVGQRIDNFLIKQLKGIPRTRLYRCLRKGEVRVNGGRKKPTYKLCLGDEVRIPPMRVSLNKFQANTAMLSIAEKISTLYQDDVLIIINKPAGIAVHAGSGLNWGVIEILRAAKQNHPFLELVHRLDRATSGCLVLALQRKTLILLHDMLRQKVSSNKRITKQYIALLKGRFMPGDDKYQQIDNNLSIVKKKGSRKRVVVSSDGRAACSRFYVLDTFESTTLVRIELLTGRMHQARVHAKSIGHPIIGDDLYGDFSMNHKMKKDGFKRMFLHAERLSFNHPLSGKKIDISAPLPLPLQNLIASLR